MAFFKLGTAPLRESASLVEVISAIQLSNEKLCLIVNDSGQLVGTLTDGDVRRAILDGAQLNSEAIDAMNKSPQIISETEMVGGDVSANNLVEFVVVLDDLGRPAGLFRYRKMRVTTKIPVVLMAGGRGSRLLPLTEVIPKPLVEIGGIPMIEILISRMADQGFVDFFISVNHYGLQIEERLGSGERLGVHISYLRENHPLGTAGALALLAGQIDGPFLVANSDLVTTCDFTSLFEFHSDSKANVTVGVREYLHQVPFGVAKIQQGLITDLVEKPVLREFVSAGIYCLDARVILEVREDEYLDMPDLVARLIRENSTKVVGFPIHETWDDVGQLEDLERVRLKWTME